MINSDFGKRRDVILLKQINQRGLLAQSSFLLLF